MELRSRLRSDARAIFAAALQAVDPEAAVKSHVRRKDDLLRIAERSYDLARVRRLVVVGAGKASALMSQGVESLLLDRIASGLVITKDGYGRQTEKIRIVEAGHPIPDSRGMSGANEIIRMLEKANDDDLVICLVSGGASALLSAPVDGITLEDKQRATQLLLHCGAKVQEINAIRKHVSKVKGGGLAGIAYPAPVVSLILSDVIGDPLDAIASGPTAPDPTTFADCLAIVDRYGLRDQMPASMTARFEAGRAGRIAETPKAGDVLLAGVQNVIVGNNQTALLAAQRQAEALGYRPLLLPDAVQGEAVEAALGHVALAERIIHAGTPVARPACVLSGGETTVTVRGNGLGGRNQEFATAAAIGIAGLANVVILSGGTDGTDGPTDAAGGIVDGSTVERGKALGLDPELALRDNDTYHFLKAVGDLLTTGPTFTNVMDIQVVLIG